MLIIMNLTGSRRNFLSLRVEADGWLAQTEERPGLAFEVEPVEAGERYVVTMELHGSA